MRLPADAAIACATMTQMTQAPSRRRAAGGSRSRLTAGGSRLTAGGSRLTADGEGVGGVGVQGQTTPGYSYGMTRKKFLIFCK